MMDDFSELFDIEFGFAQEAIVNGITIPVVFDNTTVVLDFDPPISGDNPRALLRAVDAVDVAIGTVFLINSINYSVIEPPDRSSSGIVEIRLGQ